MKNIIKIMFAITMVLSMASCVKSSEEKIQGNWDRYNTSLDPFVVDTNQQEMWKFNKGDLKIYKRSASSGLVLVADLNYSMRLSKGKVAMFIEADDKNKITPLIKESYLGESRIYRLQEDNFAMKGVETLIYYEFYRP